MHKYPPTVRYRRVGHRRCLPSRVATCCSTAVSLSSALVGWSRLQTGPTSSAAGNLDPSASPVVRIRTSTNGEPMRTQALKSIATRARTSRNWTIQSTPNLPGASQSGLSSVACTSPTSCMAVGLSDGDDQQTTLAEAWNGVAGSSRASRTQRGRRSKGSAPSPARRPTPVSPSAGTGPGSSSLRTYRRWQSAGTGRAGRWRAPPASHRTPWVRAWMGCRACPTRPAQPSNPLEQSPIVPLTRRSLRCGMGPTGRSKTRQPRQQRVLGRGFIDRGVVHFGGGMLRCRNQLKRTAGRTRAMNTQAQGQQHPLAARHSVRPDQGTKDPQKAPKADECNALITLRNASQVKTGPGSRPAASEFDKCVGDELGIRTFGLYQVELPAAAQTVCHDHTADGAEDASAVLHGSGVVVVDDREVPVGPGDFIAVTPGSTRYFRAGADGLIFIAMCAPTGSLDQHRES